MDSFHLCAGLGTRFRPHTDKVAKPAIPFLNVPLLTFGIFQAQQAGAKRFVLNLHHLPESVRAAAKSLGEVANSFAFVEEAPVILSSGGGLKNAQGKLKSDPILMINGDAVFFFKKGQSLIELVKHHQKENAFATLLTTNHPEAGKTLGGVWVDAKTGVIKRLGGQHAERGAQHFAGVYVLSQKVFAELPAAGPSHIFKDCLHKAMARGEKVLAMHVPDLLYYDTESEKDVLASTEMALKEIDNPASAFRENILQALQFGGQNLRQLGPHVWGDKGAAFTGATQHPVLLGRNARLSETVALENWAVIGPDSFMENGSLERAIVGPGLHIHEMVGLRHQFLL